MSKHKKIPLIISALVLVLTSFYSMAVWAVSTPAQSSPTDLGQLIQQIFTWSLALLGIAVFVMFFYAGFLWLTAAGNTANVDEARKRMTNAVLGAVLLLSSYLILNTINPDFVKNTVNLPGLGTTKPENGNPPLPEPGPDCTSSPDWTACQAPNQTDLVNRVIAYLATQGVDTSGTCGGYEIIKRVAWALRDTGAGALKTFHSSRCDAAGGLSGDLIAYPDGSAIDILPDNRIPIWAPMPGPITESGVSYVAPTDPGDPPESY